MDVNVLIGEVLAMISGTIGEHAAIAAGWTRTCGTYSPAAARSAGAARPGRQRPRRHPRRRITGFGTANTCGEPGGQAAPALRGRDWVRISVTDTGHGVPPPPVRRAMEPFFTTKPLGQGTGLGLATSWHYRAGRR